jgi:heme oxygenase
MLPRMAVSPASSLERLRAATRQAHERIDSGPFSRSVLDGSLSLQRYASFLRATMCVTCELEQAVERAHSPVLRSAFAHGAERRARLTQDLAYLQCDPRGVDAAVLEALVLCQRIRLDMPRGDAALLGYLYVIEGSQLGGVFQGRALAQRPELQGGGLAYLSGAGRETQLQFRTFVAKLEAALPDEAAVEHAVIGATHAFEGFERIVEAVVSPELEGRWLTRPLNDDAGTHPVPQDLREIQAALRAGEQSYQTWSYYEARYGERGLRFTRSDSAWLVTVARHDRAQALRQVRWLANVLASRGMPQLLMERHLEQLQACLTAFVPERASEYQVLREAADELRQARTSVLSQDAFDALTSQFSTVTRVAEPLASSPRIEPAEAGALLVAAVLDERAGLMRAVESLCQWLGDPARFSDLWRAAIECTLQAARAAVAASSAQA